MSYTSAPDIIDQPAATTHRQYGLNSAGMNAGRPPAFLYMRQSSYTLECMVGHSISRLALMSGPPSLVGQT